MEPKMATEAPATIIVGVPVPSHTIKRGASADFGRLFKMTRYGSMTSEMPEEYQSRVAAAMPIRITKKKLISVSASVMPICRNRFLPVTSSKKQRSTLEGLEKKKGIYPA